MVHVQKRIAEKKAAARAELFAEQLKYTHTKTERVSPFRFLP